MAKKDSEGYHAISGFASAIITIIVHYFLLSRLELHSTIHATLALFIFFLFSAIISPLLQRIW